MDETMLWLLFSNIWKSTSNKVDWYVLKCKYYTKICNTKETIQSYSCKKQKDSKSINTFVYEITQEL